jgi:RNA polymerase sigma-70 factor (ECF subfamily)
MNCWFDYDRYWRKMFFSVLKKVRSKEVAEELTQNLFVSLWEKREEASILHLENYLSTAIKYSVINHIQACFARQKAMNGAGDETLVSDSAENRLLLQELNAAIRKAIALLPPKTQEIFKLSRLEQHSVKEIAVIMNLSDKAVEYHITRSLKLMRLQLKDFMVFELALLLLIGN